MDPASWSAQTKGWGGWRVMGVCKLQLQSLIVQYNYNE
jgi:hypothetical protein